MTLDQPYKSPPPTRVLKTIDQRKVQADIGYTLDEPMTLARIGVWMRYVVPIYDDHGRLVQERHVSGQYRYATEDVLEAVLLDLGARREWRCRYVRGESGRTTCFAACLGEGCGWVVVWPRRDGDAAT